MIPLIIKDLIICHFPRMGDTAILPDDGLSKDSETQPFCFVERVFYSELSRRRAIVIFSQKTCGAINDRAFRGGEIQAKSAACATYAPFRLASLQPLFLLIVYTFVSFIFFHLFLHNILNICIHIFHKIVSRHHLSSMSLSCFPSLHNPLAPFPNFCLCILDVFQNATLPFHWRCF